MKKCSIENCQKEYYAKGYCKRHYTNLVYYPSHKKYYLAYVKKYRLEHYKRKSHKCKIKGCKNEIYSKSIYCIPHKNRIKHKLPLDLSLKCYANGSRNNQWKGGIAEYPNHYLMKKNRLLKLRQTKNTCEICGNEGYEIHHKDGSKDNHKLNNLILLCKQCHGIAHKGRQNKTSKFKRLYGMTLSQMSEKFGGSSTRYYLLHKKKLLKDFLNKC